MTELVKQLEDKKEHEHNFIDTNIPDEQMLCGYSTEGKCECGVRRFHTRFQIRWFLNGLIKLERWKNRKDAEDLSLVEVVYLIKKNRAVENSKDFTEEQAKLFLDNLDKCL